MKPKKNPEILKWAIPEPTEQDLLFAISRTLGCKSRIIPQIYLYKRLKKK